MSGAMRSSSRIAAVWSSTLTTPAVDSSGGPKQRSSACTWHRTASRRLLRKSVGGGRSSRPLAASPEQPASSDRMAITGTWSTSPRPIFRSPGGPWSASDQPMALFRLKVGPGASQLAAPQLGTSSLRPGPLAIASDHRPGTLLSPGRGCPSSRYVGHQGPRSSARHGPRR